MFQEKENNKRKIRNTEWWNSYHSEVKTHSYSIWEQKSDFLDQREQILTMLLVYIANCKMCI